jgi:hypothetical protein
MKKLSRVWLAAAMAAASLCSCSSSFRVAVATDSPTIKAAIAALGAEYSHKKHVTILTDGDGDGAAPSTVTVGWGFSPAADGGGAIPAVTISTVALSKAGYSTALAFENWASDGKSWREVPLLWDAWGMSAPIGETADGGEARSFSWDKRGLLLPAHAQLAAPGGEPGVRQALFWTSPGACAGFGASGEGDLEWGAPERVPSGKGPFASFALLAKDKGLAPGTLAFLDADVENVARTSGVTALFGNYSWQRSVAESVGREFRPLVYPLPQGYAMPASVLCARVTGKGASAKSAQAFVLWLSSSEGQKALSDRTGYMAANFNAPNLDRGALNSRNVAAGAARVVPIDPEPRKGVAALKWDALLKALLARPSEMERVLAEYGKQK